MDTQPVAKLRLEEVVSEIRSRLLAAAAAAEFSPLAVRPTADQQMVRAPQPCSMRRLASLLDESRQLSSELGGLPSTPSTVRGYAGRAAIRLLRRLLFWYSQQLKCLHEAVLAALSETGRSLERLNQGLPLISALAARLEAAERRAAMLSERNEALQRDLLLLARRVQALESNAASSAPAQ